MCMRMWLCVFDICIVHCALASVLIMAIESYHFILILHNIDRCVMYASKNETIQAILMSIRRHTCVHYFHTTTTIEGWMCIAFWEREQKKKRQSILKVNETKRDKIWKSILCHRWSHCIQACVWNDKYRTIIRIRMHAGFFLHSLWMQRTSSSWCAIVHNAQVSIFFVWVVQCTPNRFAKQQYIVVSGICFAQMSEFIFEFLCIRCRSCLILSLQIQTDGQFMLKDA